MSQYTPEQVLKMIEDNGGPQGLDLSHKDMSGIKLSQTWLRPEMAGRGLTTDNPPVWFSNDTGGINLTGAWLYEADLQGARLYQANLEGATLVYASLQDTHLHWANLHGADLYGAKLQNATLERANLQSAGLNEANLQDAILVNANMEGAGLYGAHFQRTRLSANCFGRGVGEELSKEWARAQEVYRTLKTNFRDLGQYDDARWAFVKERRMGRRANCPWREVKPIEGWKGLHQQVWGWLRHRAAEWGLALRRPRASINWLLSWVVDVFTEYLTNPWRVMLRLVPVTLLFFTLAYWVPDLPRPGWFPDWLLNDLWTRPALEGSRGFMDYLIFSARSLVTLAFPDTTPANLWAKILSPIEGAAGVTLFALFVYSLGRRVAGY